jgi:hypothetical protein
MNEARMNAHKKQEAGKPRENRKVAKSSKRREGKREFMAARKKYPPT